MNLEFFPYTEQILSVFFDQHIQYLNSISKYTTYSVVNLYKLIISYRVWSVHSHTHTLAHKHTTNHYLIKKINKYINKKLYMRGGGINSSDLFFIILKFHCSLLSVKTEIRQKYFDISIINHIYHYCNTIIYYTAIDNRPYT